MSAIIAVCFAVLGLAVGSFLNLCIDRLPRGKSIVKPGSHCDSCNKSLKAIDLVPVFSYIWLRGRCRYCGARIPLRAPVVEFATAALFAFLAWNALHSSAWHNQLGLEFAFALVYTSIFIVIFAIDLEQELILNIVVFPAMILAFVFAFFFRGGFEQCWPKVGPGFVLSALLGGGGGICADAAALSAYAGSRHGLWGCEAGCVHRADERLPAGGSGAARGHYNGRDCSCISAAIPAGEEQEGRYTVWAVPGGGGYGGAYLGG